MAYTAGNLVLMAQGNGFSRYRYDTLDAHATVATTGYFNNISNTINLRVGDIIDVVVWATAVRTGTISTYGTHIINAVTAATGVTDATDVTAGIVTDLG